MSRRRGRPSKNLTSSGQPIPGGGTVADIAQLSRTLGMTHEAVEAMMAAQGAGTSGTRTRRSGPPPPTAPVAASSAWADFMSDEMVPSNQADNEHEKGDKDNKKLSKKEINKKKDSANTKTTPKEKNDSHTSNQASYKLPIKAEPISEPCVLAQSGTLDSSIVGRGSMNVKVRQFPKIDLCEPTLIFPKSIFSKVRIGNIAASPSSCHTIAIDVSGGVYGWGRNEDGQLGLGSDLPLLSFPRKLSIPGSEKVQCAAVGKHHTILISKEGGVLASGKNHCGQLGINSNIENCNSFRRSMMVLTDLNSTSKVAKKTDSSKKKRSQKKGSDEGTVVVGSVKSADGDAVKFVQVACGENFSVILSSTGTMYTTGSSEFGQLGNGATGEHFVSASKLAFTNCHRFEPRTHFVTSEETNFSTGSDDKKVALVEDIRIGHVSCGKYHTVAIEAAREGDENDQSRRVFSWGCGDYGCLGHGVQADEYYPRQLTFFRNKMFAKNPPASGACGSQFSLILTEKGHGYYVGRHRTVGDATMRPALMDALASNGHIVTCLSGGAQSIICCTKSGVTVTWGNGPYGDLGYGESGPRSSSKPKFVPVLDSCIVTRVASGYGHTVFLIRDDDAEDKEAIKKLKTVEKDDVEEFDRSSIDLYQHKKDSKQNGFLSEDGERNSVKRKQTEGRKGEKKQKN